MKIISFLGFNPRGYSKTTYISPDHLKKWETSVFQEALVEFYSPDILYILLTKTAETAIPENANESTWATLRSRLKGKVKLEPIPNVPEGHTKEDVWILFNQLTNCLEEGDEVIFDITHGFRSLPVLALIAVSYLRVVKNIDLVGLVYGAFDAKSKETNETPIFDLLPIVGLLDWTIATDQFLTTGSSQKLANLLRKNSSATEDLADNIEGISQGLELLRPLDVMTSAADLYASIEATESIISKEIPPFGTLLRRIESDYGRFSLNNPNEFTSQAQASLQKQLSMIEWYLDKQQNVHVLSLSREWLPSLLCNYFNLDPLENRNREEMELLLNGGTNKDKERSEYLDQWNQVPKNKRKRIANLWGGAYQLAKLRNDVLHASFRKNPQRASEIQRKTREIVQELREIAQDWNLN